MDTSETLICKAVDYVRPTFQVNQVERLYAYIRRWTSTADDVGGAPLFGRRAIAVPTEFLRFSSPRGSIQVLVLTRRLVFDRSLLA